MTTSINLSREIRKAAFQSINEKSDRIMNFALAAYFLFGIFLSFFYHTYAIAIGVGGLCLLAYFVTRWLLPQYTLYQYVLSAVFAIFSAQFIYQMHGIFEMHFFFFVGSALLITYRNWTLIIPLLLITVVHHALFAWLQYQGMKEIYFTQLDYMDLQAFLFHALLAAVIMGICAYWSYDLGRTTTSDARKTVLLEKQVANMVNNVAFAEEISKGNLDMSYTLLDEQDELGKSLLRMRDNLKLSHEREHQDKFITVGITRIGDVIRQHTHNPVALADDFVRSLVKYTGINQGGLFLIDGEGEDAALMLTACYAYDRKKYMDKRVAIGEGLVGQCFQERTPVYMTVVPKDYVKITSGLGDAAPRCIYLVPVKTRDEIVGVIEVASFNELREYEMQFIEKAAENIASAIVSSRTTQRIKALLEEAQQQAEEMRAQEEEMRQNMEELQATQEEMMRKTREYESKFTGVNASLN
ncbi:MAG TPA: GAF domain-containing protein [Ohtaekwangia sp.]|uniref:GAF domain-containing protein n=1 Tax=Ohtaekwangia sp. TaxID=2066019 RepID=UPI002F95DDCB